MATEIHLMKSILGFWQGKNTELQKMKERN